MSDVNTLKKQLDATNIRLQQMQYQLQQQRQQQPQQQEEQVQFQQPPVQQPQQQYNQHQVQEVINNITQQVSQQVMQSQNANNEVQENVKKRMQRLTAAYPALTDEESPLVIKARDIYTRINQENPNLDMATKYELSVREAASLLSARPVNAPIEDVIQDFTQPANVNHSVSRRKGNKSRLNDKIIQNAMLMGINVDPSTPQGKKNLEELSEYSARFNADQDESQFRYR